jgi:hypothetical protein
MPPNRPDARCRAARPTTLMQDTRCKMQGRPPARQAGRLPHKGVVVLWFRRLACTIPPPSTKCGRDAPPTRASGTGSKPNRPPAPSGAGTGTGTGTKTGRPPGIVLRTTPWQARLLTPVGRRDSLSSASGRKPTTLPLGDPHGNGHEWLLRVSWPEACPTRVSRFCGAGVSPARFHGS